MYGNILATILWVSEGSQLATIKIWTTEDDALYCPGTGNTYKWQLTTSNGELYDSDEFVTNGSYFEFESVVKADCYIFNITQLTKLNCEDGPTFRYIHPQYQVFVNDVALTLEKQSFDGSNGNRIMDVDQLYFCTDFFDFDFEFNINATDETDSDFNSNSITNANSSNKLTLDINLGYYPELLILEITDDINDNYKSVVYSNHFLFSQISPDEEEYYTNKSLSFDINDGCYTITFYDEYYVAVETSLAHDPYTLTINDVLIGQGGYYGSFESHSFCTSFLYFCQTPYQCSGVSIPQSNLDAYSYKSFANANSVSGYSNCYGAYSCQNTPIDIVDLECRGAFSCQLNADGSVVRVFCFFQFFLFFFIAFKCYCFSCFCCFLFEPSLLILKTTENNGHILFHLPYPPWKTSRSEVVCLPSPSLITSGRMHDCCLFFVCFRCT